MHVRNYKCGRYYNLNSSQTYCSIPTGALPELVKINEELFNTDAISSSKGLNALLNIFIQTKFSLT